MHFLNALLVAALISPSPFLVNATPKGKHLRGRTYEDVKDKDGSSLPDYSPTTSLSTFSSSITLPSKDQLYSALSDDKGSVTGYPPLPVKDWSSSAPLGDTASSTNVAASEPGNDKTVIFTPLTNLSPSQTQAIVPTTSSSANNPDKDKTSRSPCSSIVTSVSSSLVVTANYENPSHVAASSSESLTIPEKDKTTSDDITWNYAIIGNPSLSGSLQLTIPSKDEVTSAYSAKHDETSFPSSFPSTVSCQYESSSELLKTTGSIATLSFKSPNSLENEKSSALETASEKPYHSSVARTSSTSSAPEIKQTATQLGSSSVLVPSQQSTTVPAKDKAYTALEVTILTPAPKQQHNINSLPFEYQQSALSLSLTSSLLELSSSYIPDKDKTSAFSQRTSSAFIPDKSVTSASPQVTSIKSIPDKDKTPSNSSVIAHVLSLEIYANLSSSLEKDQTSSSSVSSKNEATIPLSPSKDQTSSIVLTKPQESSSGTSSNHKQTSYLATVNIPSSRLSQPQDSKIISISIPGSLVYTSAVVSTSGPTDSPVTPTATGSLLAKDQTSPTPSISTPVSHKDNSVSVISSPSTINEEARESIIRNILLSYGISIPPEREQPVTSFISAVSSLVQGTATLLSAAVSTPAFVDVSTGVASVSVTFTNFYTTLITPKPEAPTQTSVPQLGHSLVSTNEAPLLNSSRVIPVWTPAMLGNAYGGGYIITPSLFVTSFPNYPESSRGIPPGYGVSFKSEDIRPLDSVPTSVAVKVEGSTTAFPSANTSPSAITAPKDQTDKPGDYITSSDALSGEDRVTLYPGAGTPAELTTRSRDKTSKPSDTPVPVTNKVDGSRTVLPGVTSPPALSTELRNGLNQLGDSSNPPNYSLTADDSNDQTSGRVLKQSDIPKALGISSSQSEYLPGKTPVPSQPSVGGNDKADRTSNLALADISTLSRVTLPSTIVSKDKTDELAGFSLLPAANGSTARISLSPLEPGYNDSTVSASRPTSVLEFEGLASKYTSSLPWGLIGISTFIFLF